MRFFNKWRVLDSELVLNHEWAKVRRDSCELPNGLILPDYYYWVGGDFAQVFALTRDERVVLVRQYKHGVQDVVIELPAGLVDPHDGQPLRTAKRELLEETGHEADSWRELGGLHVSSAKATTRAYGFLALGSYRTREQQLDASEDIEVLLASLPELDEMIRTGKIRDTNSIAICMLASQVLRSDRSHTEFAPLIWPTSIV
jgi:ADP-ribose pyrophosphatase